VENPEKGFRATFMIALFNMFAMRYDLARSGKEEQSHTPVLRLIAITEEI